MVTLGGMFNVPNVVQFLNASTPIDNKLPPSATAGRLLQPWNALVPIDVIFPAIVKVLVILSQLKNALPLMMVMLGGMFNVPNVVQFWNALVPIDNNLPPSATAGILLQPWNALVPIDVIFPAIVKVLVILSQLKNALPLMMVTLGGMFNVPNVVQFLNASAPIDNKLPPSATAGIFEQFSNALVPIAVIFPAIVIVLVILLQPLNAEIPIVVVTLSGIFMVPSVVQSSNARSRIVNKLPPSATAGILLQPENVLKPMILIFPVIVNALVIPLQPKNASFSRRVTLGGIFNVPNVVQFWNALVSIDNKLPPSATAGIFEQSMNARAPIESIFPAIVKVLVILLQPLNA
jgi:hypothetical protein